MNAEPLPPTGDTYAAVVCVGPGEHEMGRLADLVTSLVRFEAASLARLVVVDDVPEARNFAGIAQELPAGRLQVLHNARRSRGDGWSGGLAANTVFGLAAAGAGRHCAYVLKLDTDSLVIAPFHERLLHFFREDAGCGVAGSCYAVDLHGHPTPPSTWIVNLAKWQRPLRLRRNPYPRLEQGLVGVNGQIRRMISTALTVGTPAGYCLGNCAQGGGYAVRRETLDTLQNRGWLEGTWWSRTDLGEDVVVSLLATAAGWRIRDFNQPGEVFGVRFRGLNGPPATLKARGYAIIHSLKCADWESEQSLREQFRASTDCTSESASPENP